MATLRQAAQAYQPKQTKNIAELGKVPVDLELFDGSGVDENGKEFSYKYAVFNAEEYRVPNVVIGQIKDILSMNANIKEVSIKKSGQGMQTRYTTIPIV